MSRVGLAQTSGNQPDIVINAATRAEIIEGVLKRLNEAYVFPEVAKRMEAAIRLRVQRREYDQINSATTLAQTLTSHLQEVSRDKHLQVLFNYEPSPIFVPTGRAINPVTGTNWEGAGVKPDVMVSEEEALKRAQIVALNKLIETSTDEGWKGRWKARLESLQKQPQ